MNMKRTQLLLTLLLLASPALAQSGLISGVVVVAQDEDGNTTPDVPIIVDGNPIGDTGDDGRHTIPIDTFDEGDTVEIFVAGGDDPTIYVDPEGENSCEDEKKSNDDPDDDDDGFPDAEQVRVVGDKIVLDDKVHFWTNSSKIRPTSFALLERVGKLIEDNPTYVHIEVQGHTDERGPEWFNEKLSQGRANSVMEFLISRGIARERLSAKGFGSSVPLVDKKSERAWFMNRRVEFKVTRQVKQVTHQGGPNATDGESSKGGGS